MQAAKYRDACLGHELREASKTCDMLYISYAPPKTWYI